MATSEEASIYRILDACRNRACEGLRVNEEIARMHLEDVRLTTRLKQTRHDLAELLASVLGDRQIVTRNSQTDIGRSIGTPQEYRRQTDDTSVPAETNSDSHQAAASIGSITIANFKRVQQSLRTIEEFSKSETISVRNATLATSVEQVRFQIYELEKICMMMLNAPDHFPTPSVYVLLPGLDWSSICLPEQDIVEPAIAYESQFVQTVESLSVAGIDFIQLRDKQLTDRQLFNAARIAKQTIGDRATRLIVNDRPDIALAAQADGVHVGQDEMRVADVRKLAGPRLLIGVSTHSIKQAQTAVDQGADYIGIGPVFPSTTKAFNAHLGTDGVNQVCSQLSIPAFAIGGIDLENAAQISQAGCQRIAVSGIYQRLIGQSQQAFNATTEQLKTLLRQQ